MQTLPEISKKKSNCFISSVNNRRHKSKYCTMVQSTICVSMLKETLLASLPDTNEVSTCSSIFICFFKQQLWWARINHVTYFSQSQFSFAKNKWKSNYKSKRSIFIQANSSCAAYTYATHITDGAWEGNVTPRWLRVSEANEVPISSHIWVGPSTLNRL